MSATEAAVALLIAIWLSLSGYCIARALLLTTS